MLNITIYTIYSSLQKILKKLWPVFREFFIIFGGGVVFLALFWGTVWLFIMFMVCFVWITDPATWSHSLSFKEWQERGKILNEKRLKEEPPYHSFPVVYVKHLNKDNEEVLCCKEYCDTSTTKEDNNVYNDTRERIRQIKEKDLQKRQI